MSVWQALLLLPVAGGSLYAVASVAALARLARVIARARRRRASPANGRWPAVSLLKPIYGLEKGLEENLRSACEQDYPELQVVFSVQREDDPALPLLRRMREEFMGGRPGEGGQPEERGKGGRGGEAGELWGAGQATEAGQFGETSQSGEASQGRGAARPGLRVEVVVEGGGAAANGKIRNLLGALPHARHDLLVISDSDVRLRPDYLRAIVAPLIDDGPGTGAAGAPRGSRPPREATAEGAAGPDRRAVACSCTFYRAVGAESSFETLEQLTFNADFVPNLVFAYATGASPFLLGASTAIRREALAEIGGLEALGDYLVEDFEMGRRLRAAGRRIEVVPYFVDTVVDLSRPVQWWRHQVYWDQNTRAANPGGFFGTLFIRSIPFALLFALARLADPLGLEVLGAALAVRLLAAAVFLAWLGDRKGLRNLALLPLRDLAGLASWVLAFVAPTVVWRGARFSLGRDGRMAPRA